MMEMLSKAALWSDLVKQPHLILGIGEVLWDLLPEGAQLGGAPANFAVMAGRMGNHAAILSRIGRDELGSKAVELLQLQSTDPSFLQVDPAHETGKVTVSLSNGQPNYTIHQAAAWDFLELSDEWVQLVERADALCFGTLAQRSAVSRQTIQKLVSQSSSTCVRIFDVNLRTPFYSNEVIQESLELATVIKMNDAEIAIVLESLGLALPEPNARENARQKLDWMRKSAKRLLAEFSKLEMVVVTRGSHGSLLETRKDWHEHSGFPVKVADTIGAGDAFTAALTHYLLNGANLAQLNEAGNRWGSWVASQSGAMPTLTNETRTEMALAFEK
jgi:fructokinase